MKKIIFLIAITTIFVSCNDIKLSGDEVASEFLENFSGIAIQGKFEVFIEHGTESKFKIETDKNLVPYVKYEIKNDILYLYKDTNEDFPSNAQVKIHIEIPSLNVLKASNSTIHIPGTIKTENLDINIANSNLDGTIECTQLRATLHNAKVLLKGQIENTLMNLFDRSDIVIDLEVMNVKLSLIGGSVAKMNVGNELELYARDKSVFYYNNVGVFRSVILDDNSEMKQL